MRRSQTATEYLIVLAVVIVMGVIAVGVMGGIPSLGGGASESAAEAELATLSVGIADYAQDSRATTLRFKNNNPGLIRIDDMWIDGKRCTLYPYQAKLRGGEQRRIECYGVVGLDENTRFDHDFNLTYTDMKTEAQYVIDPEVDLVGTVAEGAELHTGQTLCYDTDHDTDEDDDCDALETTMPLQDAHHDGTAKSFTDNGDGTVTDDHTGLMWNKSVVDVEGITWQQALEFCNESESAGYTDWRVPNIVELMTMLDHGRDDYMNPALEWTYTADPVSTCRYFWSSTTQSDDPENAMRADINDYGFIGSRMKSSGSCVRCVRRSSQAIGLQTGQTSCYDTVGDPRTCTGIGEDADADASAKSFVDVGDGTVIDEISSLVWTKEDSTNTMNWTDALNYCANIAVCSDGSIDGNKNIVGTCSSSGVKYDDWRLPTVLESITLIDYGCTGGDDPRCYSSYQNDAFIWNINRHWTGTTYSSMEFTAFGPYMGKGVINEGGDGKGYSIAGSARCVRDY